MTIKNSVLSLAMATALVGGAYAMTTSNAAYAAEATHEANEAAAEANEAATEAAKETNEAEESSVTAQFLFDQLTAAGYTDIEDIEFDDGFWTAEAKDAKGQKVELKLSDVDGSIISKKD